MAIERKYTNQRMSQIVTHDGTIYLAGQVATDLQGDVQSQTRDILANIEELLAEAGSGKCSILSVTIYLKDINADFAGMNQIWDAWVPDGAAPARATVESALCLPEILVEMSVVAAVK